MILQLILSDNMVNSNGALKKLLFASLFSIKVVPTGVTIMITKYKKT